MHRSIIIRSRHSTKLKFTIVAALRLAFFINDHRTDRLKSINIGDIIRFHTIQPVHSEKFLDFLDGTDCSSFLTLDLLLILIQNK